MSLPDLGPWQRTVEQPLGKLSHRWAQLDRAALDMVGRPGGVGGKVGGIILGIGGAAILGLTDVGLDQPAALSRSKGGRCAPVCCRLGSPPADREGTVRTVPSTGPAGIGRDDRDALWCCVSLRSRRARRPTGSVLGAPRPGRPARVSCGWCRECAAPRHRGISAAFLIGGVAGP